MNYIALSLYPASVGIYYLYSERGRTNVLLQKNLTIRLFRWVPKGQVLSWHVDQIEKEQNLRKDNT